MKVSVQGLVLSAKQHEIRELRQLASRAELVGVIGHLVHSLQKERGASSIYLASRGVRFSDTRIQLIAESELQEQELREQFDRQLAKSAIASARLFSLMAWSLLGLEALPALRASIERLEVVPDEAVLAFSRLIAGLTSLIFEVADTALDPEISRMLVTLFHFIQGKEMAGQERALGALCFAAGQSDVTNQQRVLHLIEAQERNFEVFRDFADPYALEHWRELQVAPAMVHLERLRRILLTAKPQASLDVNLSDTWFECCTDRISEMWSLQTSMVVRLEGRCAQLIDLAERDLSDSEGLIENLKQHPPASAERIERFFDPDVNIDPTLQFLPGEAGLASASGHSLIDLLQVQSTRLVCVENELSKVRRTLNERKLIERAKGVLMARLAVNEEAAYKLLRKTAMDQNRRVIDIAEAALSLPAGVS